MPPPAPPNDMEDKSSPPSKTELGRLLLPPPPPPPPISIPELVLVIPPTSAEKVRVRLILGVPPPPRLAEPDAAELLHVVEEEVTNPTALAGRLAPGNMVVPILFIPAAAAAAWPRTPPGDDKVRARLNSTGM